MNDSAVLDTCMRVPIEHQRGTDFVLELDFAPTPLTGTTVEVLFSGADILPSCEVTKDGTIATILVRKAAVLNVVETCKYLIVFTDAEGITTPCVTGPYRVRD